MENVVLGLPEDLGKLRVEGDESLLDSGLVGASVDQEVNVLDGLECIVPHLQLQRDLKLDLSQFKHFRKGLFFFESHREWNL